MAKLTLRAIKAKHGDSLLLFAKGATVLIDGGPSGVYNQFLRDELRALERDGEDQPRIDLLMVSHIDADHIDGILDLTAELIEAREEDREPLVRIDRAWHNSFSDMIAQGNATSSASVKAAAASVASAFDELVDMGLDADDSELVLSSVAQGRQLRLDL
ncbi:MAG: MBL fold metallo-hydrolase, partial [Woeseiaceae bacterium]|nr:MBL fold metallo-hydrolase [Woeseiaceae bacterium]